MGLYSILKRSAQYAVLTVAFMAGATANHVSQKDDKIQYYQRQPGEPCVLPVEQKPIEIPGAVYDALYFGLAALAVGAFANKMRKISNENLESKFVPDNPKDFFGKEED